MREVEHGWFALWEEDLPSPEELMPLSQSLITPDLALAFDISLANPSSGHSPPPDFDTPNRSAPPGPVTGVSDSVEPECTLTRPRLVWTPQLHKRFVDAVSHLGTKNAVPKAIMQLMSVEGLTRENVASHLQKYRIYRNRMQGMDSCAAVETMYAIDATTEKLFASNIPHSFLGSSTGPARKPYMEVITPPLVHHHQQMDGASASIQQQQYYLQRQMGHFGPPIDQGFISREAAQLHEIHRPMGVSTIGVMQPQTMPLMPNFYGDDMHYGSEGGGRRVLTLFPTGIED